MTEERDIGEEIRARVEGAAGAGRPLEIRGAGTKSFYGRATNVGDPLEVGGHRGIVGYEPSELVVSARAGTPLDALERALAREGQMLPFEPPRFGDGATVGGTVACGLSGPRRPWGGAARDLVLGVTLVNGRGERLVFGGQVMKNVAGYDVSRLVTGALGTLGVLLEVSMKVLPAPAVEETLVIECPAAEAIERMTGWGGRPLPISGACHEGERLHLRLSGTAGGVAAARRAIGGDADSATDFWRRLREHEHPFFAGDAPLWRLSLPPATAPIALPGEWLLDWAGAQRWLRTDAGADAVRAAAGEAGGHATLFRGGDRAGEVFHPLSGGLERLHRRLKDAFDPHGILNPGRMYSAL